MQEIKAYRADDGKLFMTVEEAIEHESSIAKNELIEHLKTSGMVHKGKEGKFATYLIEGDNICAAIAKLHELHAKDIGKDLPDPDYKGPVKGWHRHSYGGGWVQDTATVDETAFVGPNARVFGNAYVSENASVYENACVFGNARVCGNAQVYGNAIIYENACIYGDAHVYENARVSGKAWVSGKQKITK